MMLLLEKYSEQEKQTFPRIVSDCQFAESSVVSTGQHEQEQQLAVFESVTKSGKLRSSGHPEDATQVLDNREEEISRLPVASDLCNLFWDCSECL
jgi:hypothetical protein